MRDWILVGFAEGTAGYQTLREHARALPDDERFENFTHDDRTGDTIDTTTWRIVNHLDANYQPREDLQMSFRYACKFVSETVEEDDFSGFTDLFGFEARYDIFERWDIGFRTSVRHSWYTGQLAYSFGHSLGFNPAKNLWISVGYNVDGFDDRDFSRTGFTGQGAYVQFRMKFDQETVKDLREYLTDRRQR